MTPVEISLGTQLKPTMVFSNDSLTNPDLNAGATLKVGMGAKFGLKKNVAEGSFIKILKPSNLSDKL